MDLTSRYMGLTLRCPIIAGAGPLADDLDACRRLEDAGDIVSGRAKISGIGGGQIAPKSLDRGTSIVP